MGWSGGAVRAVVVAVVAVVTTAAPASGAPAEVQRVAPAPGPTVPVQVLALNDFHGNLEPPAGPEGIIEGVPAGGVEYLATELDVLRKQVAAGSSITVAAGDVIGAAPLLSAAFHDEPTVEALDLAGLDLAGVGNHEFDEGPAELLRIQHGGCHPADGCSDPDHPYAGAGFQYLAANAVLTATGEPLLPPYAIREIGGVRVGFIGMTLEDTPHFVTPSGVAGVDFDNEVGIGNRYVAQLQAQGVQTIVVLLHDGGAQHVERGEPGGGINDCTDLQGPIVPIAEGLSDAVDVIVSGHTHQAYNCVIAGKTVTSASSDGQLVTDIDLRVDPVGGDVVSADARNVVVGRDVPADPRETALIAHYRGLLGDTAGRQVGAAAETIARTPRPLVDGRWSGESGLGDLVADAQLAATAPGQGAVAALVHPGGLRADLDRGPVLDHDALAVQPFNNYLITMGLTGRQLGCLLEQQFVTGVVLQPSATLTYTVDPAGRTAPPTDPCAGTRVADLAIAGAPVDPDATYRITVNDLLAAGGDGFSTLTGGTDRVRGELDVQALGDYLGRAGPVSAPPTDRIGVGPGRRSTVP
jgi:5'-nucleotidase